MIERIKFIVIMNIHEETLKIARNLIKKDPSLTDWVISKFPELKESEDEKIINFISNELACLRATDIVGSDRYEELTNAIAWLEKQGEHVNFRNKIQIGDKVTRNEDGVLVNLSQLKRVAKPAEKQSEQNYKITKGKNYFCVKTHNYAGVKWIKGTMYYASDNYILVNQGCECYCPEYSKEEHNNLFEEVKYDGCVEKQCEQDNNEDFNILQRFSFYSYKDEPNILYLSGLYVNEECRNKGIGTKILEVADEVAKSLNCYAIRLKTKRDSNAERLYRTHGYNSLTTEESDEIWLEKQSKNCIRWNENTDGNKPQKNHSVLMKTTHGIAEGEWKGEQWVQYRWSSNIKDSDVLSWVELSDLDRQVKNNMGISEATKQKLEDNLNKTLEKETPESLNEFLDEQDEQKFKVEKDKWYVCTSQYCNCIEGRNYRASLDGRIIDDYGTEYDMHDDAYRWFRPWTIKDAKDGDVLADDYGIYIFEKFDECDKNCFVCIGAYQYSQKVYECEHMLCSTDVHPATKDQRDLLFQKMKEAGYEWDAEKKELKKIEQKPAENSCKNSDTITTEEIDITKYKKGFECGKQRVLKYPEDFGLCKKSAEWSEEDEKKRNLLIDILNVNHPNGYFKVNPSNTLNMEAIHTEELVDWLKSLKERYTWKPSDEQMDALYTYIYNPQYFSSPDPRMELVESVYKDLKKRYGI